MKYKEGFSAPLVERFLGHNGDGCVLDPFSGMGTTALTASRGETVKLRASRSWR